VIKIYKNLVYRVIPIILPPRTHQYSDPTAETERTSMDIIRPYRRSPRQHNRTEVQRYL